MRKSLLAFGAITVATCIGPATAGAFSSPMTRPLPAAAVSAPPLTLVHGHIGGGGRGHGGRGFFGSFGDGYVDDGYNDGPNCYWSRRYGHRVCRY